MNLSIDIGNSKVKVAVFKANELIAMYSVLKEELLKKLLEIKSNYTIKTAILSSVGTLDNAVLEKIKKLFPLRILEIGLNFPFKIKYTTKDTLGVDRLALVTAAVISYPNKNVLVIDAGTCITYDFITNNANYLGGSISPGISMRYKALNAQTEKLPLLTQKHPKNFIGNTTQQSIHSGVNIGVINEIEGLIGQYKSKYPNLTVVLTGGDTYFLAEKLKSSIFANPNFLMEGLNHILNHNLQE